MQSKGPKRLGFRGPKRSAFRGPKRTAYHFQKPQGTAERAWTHLFKNEMQAHARAAATTRMPTQYPHQHKFTPRHNEASTRWKCSSFVTPPHLRTGSSMDETRANAVGEISVLGARWGKSSRCGAGRRSTTRSCACVLFCHRPQRPAPASRCF